MVTVSSLPDVEVEMSLDQGTLEDLRDFRMMTLNDNWYLRLEAAPGGVVVPRGARLRVNGIVDSRDRVPVTGRIVIDRSVWPAVFDRPEDEQGVLSK